MRHLVIFVYVLFATTHALPRDQDELVVDSSITVNTKTPSVSTAGNNAFGQCRCDITLNSCDTFCCCDKDCDEDVRAFWTENYNDYCAKNYIQQQYKPRSQCVDSNILFRKNARMGMEITELNGQTCVSMDVGGVFSGYKKEVTAYTAAQAELNPDVPQQLMQNAGLNQQKQDVILDKYTSYYQSGDQVMAKKKTGNTFSPFFLTQSGGFGGVCSNLVGTRYAQNIDSICQQFISDLKVAGESFLSAATYVLDGKTWGIAPGVKSAAAPVAITPRTVWKLDSAKGTLKKEYSIYERSGVLKKTITSYDFATNKPVYTEPDGGCTLTNAVKEVFYTVQSVATKKDQIGYAISKVYVDIIIQDTLKFTDKTFCKKTYATKSVLPDAKRLLSDNNTSSSPGGGSSVGAPRRLQKNDQIVFNGVASTLPASSTSYGFKFPMRYGIKYQTQPGKQVKNVVINRSGNPGYYVNSPLLVSSQMGAKQLAKVNQNGFVTYDHDDQGKCFAAATSSTPTIYNFHNRILKFGQTEQFSCSQTFTRQNLKDYCASTKWTGLQIFKQFDDNFKFVAKLGNPTLDNIGDWIPLKKKGFPATPADSKGKWDDDSSACEIVTGYNVLINTSVVGFEKTLQNYIVDATIEAVTERWTHYAGGSSTQEFTNFVYLSYVDYIPDQLTASQVVPSQFILPTIPKDLFYPFSLA